MKGFIRIVDTLNYRLGRIAMYGIFVIMGIMAWSVISKQTSAPSLWTLEMAQFAMVAYYVLGGPYAIQMGANVRMDLLYGDWSLRRKAWFDLFTVLLLLFYLGVLIYGAIASAAYSLGAPYDVKPLAFFWGLVTGEQEIGRLEVSRSAWRPYLWPIKLIMLLGFFLMFLQCLSEFMKDLLRLRGDWDEPGPSMNGGGSGGSDTPEPDATRAEPQRRVEVGLRTGEKSGAARTSAARDAISDAAPGGVPN